MDQAPKPKRSRVSFIWKLLSLLKLLKHLALIWHHPVASLSLLLFLLMLCTPLMRPLVRFFFPLFAFAILCMIAFISFGILFEQKDGQGSEEVGDHVSALDVLGLGGGWAAYHGFQSNMISRQEDVDLNCVAEKLEGTNEFSDVVNRSSGSPDEAILLNSLDSRVEKDKLPAQLKDQLDDLHRKESNGAGGSQIEEFVHKSDLKQEDAIFASSTVPKKERRRKIRVRFVDEVEYLHGLAGNKLERPELRDGFHSDTDTSEEDDRSILSDGSEEINSHEDCSCLFTAESKENPNYAADVEDEQEHDTGAGCEAHAEVQEAVDLQAEDVGLVSGMLEMDHCDDIIKPELEMEEAAGTYVRAMMEIEVHEQVAGFDALSNFPRELPECDAEHEEQEVRNEFQEEDKINPVNELSSDPGSSAELCVEPHSEREPKKEMEREVLIDDNVDAIDLPDRDLNSASEPDREVQSVMITEQKPNSRQEIDSAIRMEDTISEGTAPVCEESSAALLSHELQSHDISKKLDDLRQDPQKWRDWIMGIELDSVSLCSSEKETFKSAGRNKSSPDVDQEGIGIATLEEESTNSGAFIFEEENEDSSLEELCAFIQKLTEKLQAFEVESIQKKGIQKKGTNDFSGQKSLKNNASDHPVNMTLPPYNLEEDAAKLNFAELSSRAAVAPDDSNTEEGDVSSRWDEVLDTSEKDSMDSEIEEGRIWPAPESDDPGVTAVEKEFGILKFDGGELEREFRALEDELRFPCSQKPGKDGRASEEDLDPYVKLFAQTAFADAETAVPTSTYLYQEHQAAKFVQKSSRTDGKSKVYDAKDQSSPRSKGLFGKPRLSSISKAIKAMKGVKNQV